MNLIIPAIILFFAFAGFGVKTVIDNTSIPNTYDKLFIKYGSLYNVPWLLMKRICMIESSIGRAKSVKHGLENPHDVNASKSSDGKSWGIMQVTLTTARQFDGSATEVKLNNPEYSVEIAARYIAWVMKYFPKTDPRYEEWVVKSYNQGVGNTANERAGKSQGFAHDYWNKYKKYSQQIT